MAELANNGMLQKAILEIINIEPDEITLTNAQVKSSPGIDTKSLNNKTLQALSSEKGPGMEDDGREVIRFVVQFNPSELQITAGGEMDSKDYVADAAGSRNTVSKRQLSSCAKVNFKLIFDAADSEDASVQTRAEGIFAALRNEYARSASFIWGSLCYSGYLNTVQAEYTMFRPDGSPIRAEVRVGILCRDEKQGQGDTGQWQERYEDLADCLRRNYSGSAKGSIKNRQTK